LLHIRLFHRRDINTNNGRKLVYGQNLKQAIQMLVARYESPPLFRLPILSLPTVASSCRAQPNVITPRHDDPSLSNHTSKRQIRL
jgi:hypothetical protein